MLGGSGGWSSSCASSALGRTASAGTTPTPAPAATSALMVGQSPMCSACETSTPAERQALLRSLLAGIPEEDQALAAERRETDRLRPVEAVTALHDEAVVVTKQRHGMNTGW